MVADIWVRLFAAIIGVSGLFGLTAYWTGPSEISRLGELFIVPAIYALLARACFIWVAVFKR